jgi:hypothetical protein
MITHPPVSDHTRCGGFPDVISGDFKSISCKRRRLQIDKNKIRRALTIEVNGELGWVLDQVPQVLICLDREGSRNYSMRPMTRLKPTRRARDNAFGAGPSGMSDIDTASRLAVKEGRFWLQNIRRLWDVERELIGMKNIKDQR